jgi:hypothetical protein
MFRSLNTPLSTMIGELLEADRVAQTAAARDGIKANPSPRQQRSDMAIITPAAILFMDRSDESRKSAL